MDQQKEDIKPILKKHVNTIHCSNNLTLVQRKLFNALLFHAYHEMPEKIQYDIPVKKLCQLIGYDSRDYKKLKKSIVDLLTTAIEWNVIEDDQNERREKWRASAIVSAARIEKGICTYEFSSVMRELLYRPEIYGKIDLNIMTAFKSSYGLALYENCIRFQSLSSTPWLPIAIFKKLMGITQDRYSNFCDLKKRVLDVAIKEVNLYSPITVTPEIQRVNKKVVGIKFKLIFKKELTTVFHSKEDATLLKVLIGDFKLSEKIACDLLSKFEPVFIQDKIKLIKTSDSFRAGKIRDLAAYLLDSLKRNYKPSQSSRTLLVETRHQEEQKLKNEKGQKTVAQQILKTQRKELIDHYLNNLSEEEKQLLYQTFEKNIITTNNIYTIQAYKKSGMKSPSIQALFNIYIIDIINKNKSSLPI